MSRLPPQRKVSRTVQDPSTIGSSSRVSRTQFTNSEKELQQKLQAIDTSYKISSRKISSETRELRQILFDLQRELKVSKPEYQYVPSPIEGAPRKTRRITVNAFPGELRCFESSETFVPRVRRAQPEALLIGDLAAQSLSAKRRRSSSFPQKTETKKLAKGEQGVTSGLSSEEQIVQGSIERYEESVGDGTETLSESQTSVFASCEEKQEHKQTETSKQTIEQGLDVNQFHSQARKPSDNSGSESGGKSHLGSETFTRLSQSQQVKPRVRPATNVISELVRAEDQRRKPSRSERAYIPSKHFNESRLSSLSESESSYRDTFRGRFATSSLPEKIPERPPDSSETRRRRATITGPAPAGGLRRAHVMGNCTVTEATVYNSTDSGATRRYSTTQRRGQQPLLRRGSQDSISSEGSAEGDRELPTRKYSTAVGRNQGPRYSRSPRKTYLPPLKEERLNKNAPLASSSGEWKDLQKCRYLRMDEKEINIEDIFKKD